MGIRIKWGLKKYLVKKYGRGEPTNTIDKRNHRLMRVSLMYGVGTYRNYLIQQKAATKVLVPFLKMISE
jgi:hypothetical protein